MICRLMKGAVITALLGGLIFGKDALSYARTGFQFAKDRLRTELPIEFEMERARKEVEQLLPEIKRSMHLVAREQVQTEQLKQSIAKREKSLESQQESIMRLSSDLKGGKIKFVYSGQKYSQGEVEKDLSERFDRYQIAESTLKQERQVLAAKETALKANRETLEGMLSQKKTLEAELDRLEARLQTLAARKQLHGLEIDDSQLSRVKSMISSIENRLNVEDAVLAAEGDLNGWIPVEQDQKQSDEPNIAEAVQNYFSTRDEHHDSNEVATVH